MWKAERTRGSERMMFLQTKAGKKRSINDPTRDSTTNILQVDLGFFKSTRNKLLYKDFFPLITFFFCQILT